MSLFSNLVTTTMDWLKGRSVQEDTSANPTQRRIRRPRSLDLTEQIAANEDVTRGLWRNTYPNTRLGGSLAFAPIFVPVAMMGLPVPTSDDEATQAVLTDILNRLSHNCWMLHRICHRDGTCWVWPLYSAKEERLIWEFIPDSSVTDVIKDIYTGTVREVITNEELTVSAGENDQRVITRWRSFTREQVRIRYTGSTGTLGLQDVEFANPASEIPVHFSNEVEPNEVRGISDYARMLSDLKNYHDIDLAWSTALAKFKPKLVLGVKNVDSWLAQNGYTDIDDLDVPSADVLFYLKDVEEPPKLLEPPSSEAYATKLKQTFHKIVEASGVPEIAWGLKTEGNHASAEEQMATLVAYAGSKQDQKRESYKRLFGASLRLLSTARIVAAKEFTIEWNKLDAVSDAVRSEIFKNFAQGLGYVMQWAGITNRQLHAFWKLNFPDATEEDYEEFREGTTEMAKFRQFSQAKLEEAFDVASPYEEREPPEGRTEPLEEKTVADAGGNGHRVLQGM